MTLPKQSQPVTRTIIPEQSLTNNSGITPAGIDDCYKLPGASRKLCITGYINQ